MKEAKKPIIQTNSMYSEPISINTGYGFYFIWQELEKIQKEIEALKKRVEILENR